MDFDDFEAKTTRKVRIEANFACNVLLEAILGPVLEGGGLEFIYPKIRGKSTAKSGANLWQNLWQSHDSSRRRNPENRWKSWKMIKIDIGFLGSHLASSVVPYWKMDDFGRVEVSRLAEAWLAGQVS